MSEQSIEGALRAHDSYSAGFETDIESVTLEPGLNRETIEKISARKGEPAWLLEWRLEAFEHWQTLEEPEWAHVNFPKIDFQAISYFSSPKSLEDAPSSLEEIDPELLRTYEKLGIPLHEQEALAGVRKKTDPQKQTAGNTSNIAVDVVFDSVSVTTTFKEKLAEAGVVFCPLSEAVHSHPELIQKYLGSVVPRKDNFYAALNSAVFSDGSFVYIPKGVKCPMELSTYFRINERNTGQFERTLIIAEDNSYVSYLEGCTAPMSD